MTHKKITASADDVLSGQKIILGARLVAGATAAASAILFNGAQTAALDFCKLLADTAGVDYDSFAEGMSYSAIGVTLAGAGAILYIYYA